MMFIESRADDWGVGPIYTLARMARILTCNRAVFRLLSEDDSLMKVFNMLERTVFFSNSLMTTEVPCLFSFLFL